MESFSWQVSEAAHATGRSQSPTGALRTLLSEIRSPEQVKALPASQLSRLAAEIRDFLIEKVSRTGGHLGPNLGAVELTLALHRVFSSPRDKLLFDVGHQAYVHKILTGRHEVFDTLRQHNGLTGYPHRAESEHDIIENSHASTALSYADGLAKAYELRGESDRAVVAVVGDGALTGGMCWEALNNIAAAKQRPVIVVVNDNGRSYSPTIGGVAARLQTLRSSSSYETLERLISGVLEKTPLVGPPMHEALRTLKRALKDVILPDALFVDLGMRSIGPIDGHNIAAMEEALAQARDAGEPVVVHAVTRKGYGYQPAEDDEADCLHGVSAFDPHTGKPLAPSKPKWTSIFADELVTLAGERPDIVGITAAMAGPTGIDKLAQEHPERSFDVGIAEQHAVTSAAGLSMGGMHPVVAVYSTFMNRAFDQVLLDTGLHRCGATFVLDRAGITGPDGPSHYGIWDLSLFTTVPGIKIAAPRDGEQLRAQLREAIACEDAPTFLRFPTGSVNPEIPSVQRLGTGYDACDLLTRPTQRDILLVAVGAFALLGVQTAARLREQGIGVTVLDPRWVFPVSAHITELATQHERVVTLEDGVLRGGIGEAITAELHAACEGQVPPVRTLGVPREFHPHGTREEVLADLSLTSQSISESLIEWVSQGNAAQFSDVYIDA